MFLHARTHAPRPVPHAGLLLTAVTSCKRCCLDDPRSAHCVANEIAYCEERGWVDSLAWVVMPDHVHWLLEVKENSANACMAVFKARSERAIQQVLGTRERIWEAGFHERRLRERKDVLATAQEIIRNPLRRGLVQRIDHYPYWFCLWMQPGSAARLFQAQQLEDRHPP